ncbi:hypothetical protein GTA51_15575 [Desulfovibrio aerotolerans]|uniref:Uncharacterized protein n=1 Tax=Solidesulfovibrio aerotolerans TaxID=295255 RepID=A0A7C9IV82_9BACT|nr:hypothetical protein [Solidesulfovibrio aerotolerans]MYL84540.1 hypothetical protein [Solidesulfovibrio aerotolerans]
MNRLWHYCRPLAGDSPRARIVQQVVFGLGLLAAALLLAAISEARAAEGEGVEVEEALGTMGAAAARQDGATKPAWGEGLGLSGEGSYVAPAKVSGASMSVWQEEAKITYDTGTVGVDLGYVTGQYAFSNVGRLPFAGQAPFERLSRLEAGLTVQGGLWDDISGFVGLRGTMGYEKALTARGLGGTALAGLSLPLGRQWRMTVGGGVSLTPVAVQAVPLLSFRYAPDSLPELTAELGFPRTEVAWRGGSWWGLRLTGGIEGGQYRLAEDNPAAPDGVADLFSARVGAWVDVYPARGLGISLGALYALPGTMTLYRESGSRLKTYDTGGAPGGALRLRYDF